MPEVAGSNVGMGACYSGWDISSFLSVLTFKCEKVTYIIPWRTLFFFQFTIRQLRSNLIRWTIGSFVRWTTNRVKKLVSVHFPFVSHFGRITFSSAVLVRDLYIIRVFAIISAWSSLTYLNFSWIFSVSPQKKKKERKKLKLGLDSLPLRCNLFFTYRPVTNAVQSCVSESVTKATTVDVQNTPHNSLR